MDVQTIKEMLAENLSHRAENAALLKKLERSNDAWIRGREENEGLRTDNAALKTALADQRRRMGNEYDTLNDELKRVRKVAGDELTDYAKTVERLNRDNAALLATNRHLAEDLGISMQKAVDLAAAVKEILEAEEAFKRDDENLDLEGTSIQFYHPRILNIARAAIQKAEATK